MSDDGFVLQLSERPGELLVTMAGAISETTTFAVPDVRGRRVIIDPRGVERLNSMGVRNWIDFIERLQSEALDVVIRHLPPAMVSQASMITTFIGNTRVESFLSPWYCPSCENTLEQLHGYRDNVPAAISCPRCRAPMELDWDRDAYLAFRSA